MTEKIEMEARPAEDVHSFALRMLTTAAMTGKHVVGRFNQFTFHAVKRMRIEEIIKPWSDDFLRSYFGRDR